MKFLVGNCIELMHDMGKFDLILTDPPYNAKNIGHDKKVYSKGLMCLPDEEYRQFCADWFSEAIKHTERLVFTPGIANICYYPQPRWVLCWYKPAACSFNRMGGYNAWEPIFIYGKPVKRIAQDVIKVNTLNFSKGAEKNHPCPKQPDLWRWLLNHFSNKGESVLDPFSGSGTTAVVCAETGREFTGIDINEDYNEISKKRLKNLQRMML